MWEHCCPLQSLESESPSSLRYLPKTHLRSRRRRQPGSNRYPPRCWCCLNCFQPLLTIFLKNCRNRFCLKDLRSHRLQKPLVCLACEHWNWTTRQELCLKFPELQNFECHRSHRLKRRDRNQPLPRSANRNRCNISVCFHHHCRWQCLLLQEFPEELMQQLGLDLPHEEVFLELRFQFPHSHHLKWSLRESCLFQVASFEHHWFQSQPLIRWCYHHSRYRHFRPLKHWQSHPTWLRCPGKSSAYRWPSKRPLNFQPMALKHQLQPPWSLHRPSFEPHR